jgi:hypothetical protein
MKNRKDTLSTMNLIISFANLSEYMAFMCTHCFKGKENANALQIGLPYFLGIKTAIHKMILPKIFD